jgi:RNA-binding protein 39
MAKKLFVGNINWNASKEDLENIFSQYGELEEAILIKDENGRSKGFGFITYVNDADAVAAAEKLNGFEIDGRPLFVNEARPQEKRERNFR